MPKIIINEVDKTTNEYPVQDVTDVVLVPGCSINYREGGWDVESTDTKYAQWKGEHVDGPMLCTSLAQFEAYFGEKPAVQSSSTLPAGIKFDKSYVYAKELINAGLPVLYYAVTNETLPSNASSIVASFSTYANDNIKSMGDFQVKYLTSILLLDLAPTQYEAQATTSCWYVLSDVANTRGDCVYLYDVSDIAIGSATSTATNTVYGLMASNAQYLVDHNLNPAYVTNISPWAEYQCNTLKGVTLSTEYESETVELKSDGKVTLPGSFAYLMSLAKSIRTNPNYLAIAGVARGLVPNITKLSSKAIPGGLLSNKLADDLQPRDGYSINCITNIRPYGLTIWGNRTLADNKTTANGGPDGLTASSFLNLRNLICDVKKNVYNTAKSFMFEQNSDVLWVQFKARIATFLDSIVAGQGIKDYKIIKVETKSRGKLQAEIILYPTYAVEEFEINVILTDDDVTVE